MVFNKFYSEQFGLYHVDFNSKEKIRTPKASAKVYANIVKTRSIDWNFNAEPTIIAERHLYNASTNMMANKFDFFCVALIQYILVHLLLKH